MIERGDHDPLASVVSALRAGACGYLLKDTEAPRIHRPGAACPHREDEAAYVISGVLTFIVGDHRFEATAGELVWLPRQVLHTFANLGDEPVWAFGVTTPAGLEGMLEEQSAYFAGLHGAPDPDRIREIGARYGVRSLGPPISPE